MRHFRLAICLLRVLILGVLLGTEAAYAAPFAYIANQGSNNVSVIDTATNAVVATVAVGSLPTGVAVNPAGTFAYVANESDSTVSVIDTATNTVVATVPVGQYPYAVAVNPAGTFFYTANFSGSASVIDTATNTVVATVPLASAAAGVAVNPAGTLAYVTNGPFTVSVIDTATNTVVANVTVVLGPVGVAVNPAGTFAYVANSGYDKVSVIDTATNTVVATVPFGSTPEGVAVNPAGSFAYVTNGNGGSTVSVIDTATNVVVATVPVGLSPYGVAVNPAGTFAYVANAGSNTVSVINTATNTVVATVLVGTAPLSIGNFIGPAAVPDAPTGATATAGNAQATVTFTAPASNGGSPITGYTVISNPAGGVDSNAGTTVTTHAVTGLTNGTTYTFMVTATNAVGTSAPSSASNSVTPMSPSAIGTLASSLDPSTLGTSVTFTAIVTGSNPTGSVNFTDGGSSIMGCGAVALTGSGNSKTAACSTSALTATTHSIAAAYGGDAGNTASTSGVLSQVVNEATSTTTLTSSANPSTVGTSVTFTATVTGNVPTGSVAFTADGTTISSCAAVALSAGSAACSTSNLAVGPHSILASYGGDAKNVPSTSGALSQTVNSAAERQCGAGGQRRRGLGVEHLRRAGFSFPVCAVNNGDRTGLNWGHGGGWNSAIANVFPDWVQITFNGQKTINQVIVYTLQDNFTNPVDPPANLTFTLYGVTAFQVQGWNGSAWVNLGAAVSGNNLVKRPVSFPAFTTNSIRVNITAALASYSRIVEIEAWTATGKATATTTTLSSSANPSTRRQNVTFTATVAGSGPTGSVNFTDGGSSIAGCAAVALSSGKAICTTNSLAVATHSIVANYGGDANNAASVSSALAQVVKR